ncbi:MAG: hypothetical protein WAT55_06295 [Candidatus Microthrix parvicella]|jgi:hypothetical protein|nr:hypothetical protein [Candidatus Microthrix parvicella]
MKAALACRRASSNHSFEHLTDPNGVTERIPDSEVNAVRLWRRFARDVDPRASSVSNTPCASSVVKHSHPPIALGHQLAYLQSGRLVHRWRTGLLQEDLATVVARDANGEPPHEPKDIHVEVTGLVLVENEDR